MIKRYCDCCGDEINYSNKIDDDKFRLEGKLKKNRETILRVEVITGKDDTWNDGDFCKYCVIDAINKLDDRPKEGVCTK